MNGVPAAAAFQRRLVKPDQIFGLLLDLDFAITQKPEHPLCDDRETRKEMVEEQRDHLFDRQKPNPIPRKSDEPADRRRY